MFSLQPVLYESLPGTPSREGALSLTPNVPNPAYVSSSDLKNLTTNAPSGDKLPASESGYFESTQQSQAEAQLAAERPRLSASLPSIPVIIVSSAQHVQQ